MRPSARPIPPRSRPRPNATGRSRVTCGSLATRLGTFSANGETFSREVLETLLARWMAELLPPDALEKAPVPRQLPGAPGDFVGRHDELAVLREAVERDGLRVVVIR